MIPASYFIQDFNKKAGDKVYALDLATSCSCSFAEEVSCCSLSYLDLCRCRRKIKNVTAFYNIKFSNCISTYLISIFELYKDKYFHDDSGLSSYLLKFLMILKTTNFDDKEFFMQTLFSEVVENLMNFNRKNGLILASLMMISRKHEKLIDDVICFSQFQKVDFILSSVQLFLKDRLNEYSIFKHLFTASSCLINNECINFKCFLQYGYEAHPSSDTEIMSIISHFWESCFNEEFNEMIDWKPRNISLQRLMYIVHMYFVLSKEEASLMETTAVLWNSISDIYVSKKEMCEVLTRMTEDCKHEDIIKTVDKIDSTVMGEAVGPRSLKHNCRSVIRRSINDNGLLPNGLYQLPLPVSLKSYLNLEA